MRRRSRHSRNKRNWIIAFVMLIVLTSLVLVASRSFDFSSKEYGSVSKEDIKEYTKIILGTNRSVTLVEKYDSIIGMLIWEVFADGGSPMQRVTYKAGTYDVIRFMDSSLRSESEEQVSMKTIQELYMIAYSRFNITDEYKLVSEGDENVIPTFSWQRYYNNISVESDGISLFMDFYNGNIYAYFDVYHDVLPSHIPAVSQEDAISTATKIFGRDYDDISAELLYDVDKDGYLALLWKVTFVIYEEFPGEGRFPFTYFKYIDAQTGEFVKSDALR